MTSAHAVLLALVLAAGVVGVAHAQAPWLPSPGPWPVPPPIWPDAVPGPLLASPRPFGGATIEAQACATTFAALRSQVEKVGMAAKAGSEKQVSREEMCKLVTAYASAESKWMQFTTTNKTKCGIPASIVDKMTTVHIETVEGQNRLCAAAGGQELRVTLPEYGLAPSTQPNPEYRFGPPTRPIDFKARPLPLISGR